MDDLTLVRKLRKENEELRRKLGEAAALLFSMSLSTDDEVAEYLCRTKSEELTAISQGHHPDLVAIYGLEKTSDEQEP